MEFEKFTDVMLDVETLGNEGKFIVLSIALVPFNPNTGKVGKAYSINIDLADSINLGFKANRKTIKWWSEQESSTFIDMFKNTLSIERAINSLITYININNFDRFWATAVLDYQAISNLCEAVNLKNPIVYNKRLCARTVRTLHDTKFPNIYVGNTHNAEDDCKRQIEVLLQQLKALNIDITQINNV